MRKLRMDELNRLSVEQFKEVPKKEIRVVLDNVRSALNIGSVFRTSDAFRIQKIYLCGVSAKPGKEMNKTALGATDSVDWSHHDNVKAALDELKHDGFRIIAVEQTRGAVLLDDLKIDEADKLAFIFGNEVKGVSQEALDLCDEAMEIPQYGTKHSLNIAVSAGIVLWHAQTRLT